MLRRSLVPGMSPGKSRNGNKDQIAKAGRLEAPRVARIGTRGCIIAALWTSTPPARRQHRLCDVRKKNGDPAIDCDRQVRRPIDRSAVTESAADGSRSGSQSTGQGEESCGECGCFLELRLLELFC